MIVATTTDEGLIKAFASVYDGSWGDLKAVDPRLSQSDANKAVAALLATVDKDEPLGFLAHGNDTEIGDSGGAGSKWEFGYKDIAGMMNKGLPAGYAGPVIFVVCCDSVANFSAHVAVWLGELGKHGVWCYGYNRPTGYKEKIPKPANVDKDVALQPTKS